MGVFVLMKLDHFIAGVIIEVFSTLFLGSGREGVEWGKEVARMPIT